MRHYHPITPTVVHGRARQALRHVLDWAPFHESVSVEDLLDLLLLMAASAASLYATVRRFFSFSHQTGSLAVKANLPDRASADQLTRGLVEALYDVMAFSRQDRRRRWMVAIDVNNVPYYGPPTPDVVGGPKKQGTKWFYAYATAVLLHKHRRYTVALAPLPRHAKPHEIVRFLLDQIAEKGLKIRGVTLDSGFDSGETLLLLQERRDWPYSLPCGAKARAATLAICASRASTNRFAGRSGPPTRPVGKFGRERCCGRDAQRPWCSPSRAGGAITHGTSINKPSVFANCTVPLRFGIETSYRQKNQAKATTTSRDPVYRAVVGGPRLFAPPVWVVLTEELARHSKMSPNAWIGALTVQKMIDWLIHELTNLHPETLEINGAAA